MAIDEFVMTIDSDVEDPPPTKINKSARASKSSPVDIEDTHLNPEFTFDLSGDVYIDLLGYQNDLRDVVKTGSKPVSAFRLLISDTY